MTYPIAEIFHSLQGEGHWVGTPMMFVRLAGCNVGRYVEREAIPTELYASHDFPLLLEKKHSVCTTVDGHRFLCDTDYHKRENMEPSVIAAMLGGYKHVCITGGEPFLHDLKPLINVMPYGVMVHIETSGTLEVPNTVSVAAWITCCPKHGFDPMNIDAFHEWKFLVGSNFDVRVVERLTESSDAPIYLQPINGVNEVWQENLERCIELCKQHPHLRLSAQMHKTWGVR